jgi:alpha-galactosidase
MKLELLFILAFMAGSIDAAEKNVLLTPKPGPAPRINGPLVYGIRPGHEFLYRIPAQGERPITFSATGLPETLSLDPHTGIITGANPGKGEYVVTFTAANRHGKNKRSFKIISGETLALTPPMGWNHWYAHYDRITDAMMREAATALVKSGMADVGYQYINIDDCWMNAEKHKDPQRNGPFRDNNGHLIPNTYFPDMQALTAFIHQLGLKAGIYISPGPTTCAGFAGSYQHEAEDARQFAEWGFDFLKYDWCSYDQVVHKVRSLENLQKPYILMGRLLQEQNRDIILNLCQYGMGNVWEWGAKVGGHSWRTAGDLGIELNRIFPVALKNAEHRAWSKPGSWNDPDYIQIGHIGDARTCGEPKPCPLTADEQYAFMSLWCLMASPLFYSGDMSKLDELTLNVLCNPEVIEVDQDPLGVSAQVDSLDADTFLMVKEMYDGSKAVGLCNRGETPRKVTAEWSRIGVHGKCVVRDLWRQKDLGLFDAAYAAEIPRHGVALVRIQKAN